VRGNGPRLLLISGGPTDADIFVGLADQLADRYTVVTYDPRGNSRSSVDNPDADLSIERHADDAHHLLASFGDTPTLVFGNSSGALVGLDLATRYAQQVRTLIAHEPPCVELLPDREQQRAQVDDVYAT